MSGYFFVAVVSVVGWFIGSISKPDKQYWFLGVLIICASILAILIDASNYFTKDIGRWAALGGIAVCLLFGSACALLGFGYSQNKKKTEPPTTMPEVTIPPPPPPPPPKTTQQKIDELLKKNLDA